MTDIAALIRQIAKKNGLTPAQTAVLIAGARVESGLNPNAVGDQGSSFGLYQMHIGGAGGKTKAEAQRYLDPVAAITNRARFVKQQNITDGAGFAALQRPADPSGYAAKINAALGGGGAGLNAPVTSLGMGPELPGLPAVDPRTAMISGLGAARAKLKPKALAVTPDINSLRDRTDSLRDANANFAAWAKTAAPAAAPVAAPVAGGLPTGDGSNEFKDILKLGSQFGLRTDGGDAQTTGGKHADGSYHYQGRAVDFGDAKNSAAQLQSLAAWARAHAGEIKELFYNPLGWGIKNGKVIKGLTVAGHDNHLHIAI